MSSKDVNRDTRDHRRQERGCNGRSTIWYRDFSTTEINDGVYGEEGTRRQE